MLENSHTKECSYDNQNVGEFQNKSSKTQLVISRELISVKTFDTEVDRKFKYK